MTLITFCVQAQSAGEVVSDAGIVESITLKNFMCHSLLGPFTFGSNVNFVVGNNGSECNLFNLQGVFQETGVVESIQTFQILWLLLWQPMP